MKKKPDERGKQVFFILLVVMFFVGVLAIAKAKGLLISGTSPISVEEGTIALHSLTLEQKVAQMVIVHGGKHNLAAWRKMQLGGIHLFAMKEPELFTNIITLFQNQMAVPFFVTGDLEGCQNLFGSFQGFPAASEITTEEAAYAKGQDEGRYLRSLGFSINFAPVVDLHDEIWKCRTFPGDEQNVARLALAYVEGLQSEGIIGTAKHYPGKTLVVRDPHKYIVAASIEEEDLYPYTELAEVVDAVMVGHLITFGEVDSDGVPSVASGSVVGELKDSFTGLVVSDEINMLGLKDFYPTLDEMYIAVFSAGNDLILNFNEDPNEVQRMISIIVAAIRDGRIAEERVDMSVTKILEAKGFRVV